MVGLLVLSCIVATLIASASTSTATTTNACQQDRDSAECLKEQVLNVVDEFLGKDIYEVSDSVTIFKNNNAAEIKPEGRSLLNSLSDFVETHDVKVKLPGCSSITISPRKLDLGEFSAKLNLDSSEGRRRKVKKHKLKKILIPVAIFLVLKALTLIPLALSLLGIKAWNALQLGFGSFIVSFALAVYNLTKKIMGDSHPPFPPTPIVAHTTGWDKRSEGVFETDPQTLAYNAYRR